MDNFVTFELPDGRLAFIRRAAVTVVFDREADIQYAWQPVNAGTPADAPLDRCGNAWVEVGRTVSSTVHTNTTAMPVPYTAQHVMEILYGAQSVARR